VPLAQYITEAITRDELEAEADALLPLERYDDDEGFSYWDHHDPKVLANDKVKQYRPEEWHRISCTQCTNSARILASKHNGAVFGYAVDNPRDERIGAFSGGHDFSVIGEWLVDYWAKHVDGTRDATTLHLKDDAEEIKRLYGDPDSWVLVGDYRHDGLTESPEISTLKDHTVKLTDEERREVMKAGATWHHGKNGEATPAVRKSKIKGQTWYWCSTHRYGQVRKTLKSAISAYHNGVKQSA
jgi:YHS domain-containing protein